MDAEGPRRSARLSGRTPTAAPPIGDTQLVALLLLRALSALRIDEDPLSVSAAGHAITATSDGAIHLATIGRRISKSSGSRNVSAS